ncbi:MAG: hypothetical protein IKG01_13635 [Lachnospiraceae bacterium]|nr:hypothetical protein [Lachnospiraceae bacterium]
MKYKLLETELMTAAENIAKALRTYTGEPLACDVFVESREKAGSDFVAITVSYNSEDEHGQVINKGERIIYSFNDFEGDAILKTVPVFAALGGDPDGT